LLDRVARGAGAIGNWQEYTLWLANRPGRRYGKTGQGHYRTTRDGSHRRNT